MYSENESGFLVSGVRGQDTDLSSAVASLLGYALGVELEAYGVPCIRILCCESLIYPRSS